jgi:hypothetical protein
VEAPAENPSAELGEEEGDAAAMRGQLVAEGARPAVEQPFAGQASEVIPHLAGGVLVVWDAEELGDVRAELAVGDPGGQHGEGTQGLQQGVDARLADP